MRIIASFCPLWDMMRAIVTCGHPWDMMACFCAAIDSNVSLAQFTNSCISFFTCFSFTASGNYHMEYIYSLHVLWVCKAVVSISKESLTSQSYQWYLTRLLLIPHSLVPSLVSYHTTIQSSIPKSFLFKKNIYIICNYVHFWETLIM